MNVAFLGCGYVANMYRLTLSAHKEVNLLGVFHREQSRSESFAKLTGSKCYKTFDELLGDTSLDCVINLTTPEEHFVTTKKILESGKHVYTEKPVAMSLNEAIELVELAEKLSLLLVSAPCTLMNKVAQTCWNLLLKREIGEVRLVYAEMDDGMISEAPLTRWINEAGVAWPYINEFETGCTVEHAAYVLSWLTAFFGPAVKINAFADTLLPNKVPGVIVDSAPDFSVATIKFENGTVARLTNGIYAEHSHSMRFFGDKGVITVEDPRSDNSNIVIQKYVTIRRKRFLSPFKRKLKPGAKDTISSYRGSQVRDFCRAISDMASCLRNGTQPYLAARQALHVNELTLASQYPEAFGSDSSGYKPITSFQPMFPVEKESL